MQPDLQMQSLQLKYNVAISSVKCTLSDQTTVSPVFEKPEAEHQHVKKISFNMNMYAPTVRYIQASDARDCVNYLYFLDKDRQIVAHYDPYQLGGNPKKDKLLNRNKAENEIELAEDEKIVGVYGAMGGENWFKSLGLLTRVRLQEEEEDI